MIADQMFAYAPPMIYSLLNINAEWWAYLSDARLQ